MISDPKTANSRRIQFNQFAGPIEGFTLAELMIAVALIGILAAIATSNYRTFTAKARTVEAKLALSNAYTNLVSFFGEQGSYTACLRKIGYSAGDTPRYYAIGFSSSGGMNCGKNGDEDCLLTVFGGGGTPCNGTFTSASDMFVSANAGDIPQPYPQSVVDAFPSSDSFVVGACGVILSGFDEWSINSSKIVRHRRAGY